MIIHVRTAHRRCQAQIVAQDTEQKHGKHFFSSPSSPFFFPLPPLPFCFLSLLSLFVSSLPPFFLSLFFFSLSLLRVRFHVRMLRCSAPLLRQHAAGAPLPCCGCSVLLFRYQAVWSPPLLTACVCDLCRVSVLVRLSHLRLVISTGVPWVSCRDPPCAPDAQAVWHRSQSANSCCAELCCVVVSGGASSTSSCGLSRPYVLFCVFSHPSSTRDTSHHSWLIALADTTGLRL